jgi:hypothetical protein
VRPNLEKRLVLIAQQKRKKRFFSASKLFQQLAGSCRRHPYRHSREFPHNTSSGLL